MSATDTDKAIASMPVLTGSANIVQWTNRMTMYLEGKDCWHVIQSPETSFADDATRKADLIVRAKTLDYIYRTVDENVQNMIGSYVAKRDVERCMGRHSNDVCRQRWSGYHHYAPKDI